jgi:hypothetical protein
MAFPFVIDGVRLGKFAKRAVWGNIRERCRCAKLAPLDD